MRLLKQSRLFKNPLSPSFVHLVFERLSRLADKTSMIDTFLYQKTRIIIELLGVINMISDF